MMKYLLPILVVGILFLIETTFIYFDRVVITYLFHILVPFTALLFFMRGVMDFFKRRFLEGASFFISIILLCLAFGLPPIYLTNAMFVSSFLKVTKNEGFYLKKIAQANLDKDGFRYAEFRNELFDSLIVYDSSDRVSLKNGIQEGIFMSRWGKVGVEGKSCVAVSRKLKGHFYFVITNSDVC